jgi:predicted nucleotidyltransferase
MADPVSDNLLMLMRVVDRLAPLRHRLVFLGGAVAELFITLPGVLRPRQTKDVDVVVNVVNLGEYSETLRDQLIALGLEEDTSEGAPVCRWLLDDLIVDIMPTRGEILGFSSVWYPLAYETATPVTLPNGTTIRLVTPACFLVTKLTAFGDRGRRHPIASHDLEDVIAVIDGREEITADVTAAPANLRAAIAEMLEGLLALPDAEDVIAAQLLPDAKSQDRLPFVLDRIGQLIAAGRN